MYTRTYIASTDVQIYMFSVGRTIHTAIPRPHAPVSKPFLLFT